MTNIVYIKNYKAPPIDKKEIFRYAGVREAVPEISELLDSCLAEASDRLSYKVCYREFSINHIESGVDLGFVTVGSKALSKNLSGCESVILFAATVGIEIDRFIARYASISPTRSLLFQAIGVERIEALCDIFNKEITAKKASVGFRTRPRFSPGYGDLSIDIQRDIFAVLDCQRKIGLALNESLLMSPSKSVTALIGVGK